jgi:transcriptional regulator with XRE-family HTH domain
MREIYVELGQLVREHRMEKKMTQLELAQKLGYNSTQFVSLFERGMSKVPINTLGQLIVVLGIPEKKVTQILIGAYRTQVMDEISKGKATAVSKAA